MALARVAATVLTAVALALTTLLTAFPANAATGFHASYFSESSFLTLGPGGTGQFAVGFANTGDQAWVKGTNAQTSLHTRLSPYDNTQDFQTWGVGWTSASVYAVQSTDLVAPGQVGFFVYNIKVPTNAPSGPHTFWGLEWLDSQGPLEDYGYFQIVTVQSSAITITGTNPASPSQNQTPIVSGTGSPNGATVTVQEGSTVLCSTLITSAGTFSCTTSLLSEGSHSLTATVAGTGTSAPFTYVVDRTAPAVSSASTTNSATVLVNFSEPMTCTTGSLGSITTGTNYTFATSPGGAAVAETVTAAANSACTQATLVLSAPLTVGAQYTVTANNVQDAAGNVIGSSRTATFTVTDTSGVPTATAAATGSNQITVTYSKPMDQTTTGAAANYRLDSVSCATLCSSVTTTTTTAVLTFTTAPSLGNHVLDISNVKDTSGTTISPNPTSITVTFSASSTRPTVTGASATNASTIAVTYSTNMDPATAQSTAAYRVQNATTGGTYSGVSAATCQPSTANCTSVNLTPSTNLVAGSYSVVVTGVKDTFGNVINPNPTTAGPFTFSSDTTAPAVSTVTGSQTAIGTALISITFTEAMKHVLACGSSGAPQSGTGPNIDNRGDYTVLSGPSLSTLNAALQASATAAVSADCRSVTFTVSGNFDAGSYSLQTTTAQDAAGNTVPTTTTGFAFTDAVAPTISSVSGVTATSLTVNFTKRMIGGSTVTNSAGNPGNYQVNNLGYGNLCLTGGTASITASSDMKSFTVTCSGANGRWTTTGGNTLTVKDVADYNSNVISPNPSSVAF